MKRRAGNGACRCCTAFNSHSSKCWNETCLHGESAPWDYRLSTPTPAEAGMKRAAHQGLSPASQTFNSHSSTRWNETTRLRRIPITLSSFNSHSSKCWNETRGTAVRISGIDTFQLPLQSKLE